MNTVVSFQNSLKYLYTEIKQLLSIWFLMLHYCSNIIFTLVHLYFIMYDLVKILTLIKNMEFGKSQN